MRARRWRPTWRERSSASEVPAHVGAPRTRAGVGVVVRSADGLVLVGRRRAEPGAALAVPGGKLKSGETGEERAVRELREETGLVLDAAAVRTFDCVLVADEPTSWVVAGVEGRIGV